MKIASKRSRQKGFIVSMELVLIGTILVIGLIVGMAAIRDAMTAEMNDVAQAINSMNQSYSFSGIVFTNSTGATLATIAGSSFNDQFDTSSGQAAAAAQAGVINWTFPAAPEL